VRERALAPLIFDVSDIRGAAAALLVGGAALSLLPGHAGLPCPLRTLTGIPCPLCGMTTSVESTLRGHPLAAVGANPTGPLVVLAAVVLLVRRPSRSFGVPLALVLALLVALWLFELHRFAVI
jgi:Protein of unknown function (DUF2752)